MDLTGFCFAPASSSLGWNEVRSAPSVAPVGAGTKASASGVVASPAGSGSICCRDLAGESVVDDG